LAIKGLVLPISGITPDYHPTNNTFITLLHVHCTIHILYTQSKVAVTEDPPSSTLPPPPSLPFTFQPACTIHQTLIWHWSTYTLQQFLNVATVKFFKSVHLYIAK